MTTIPKKYKPQQAEPRIQRFWAENEVYAFAMDEAQTGNNPAACPELAEWVGGRRSAVDSQRPAVGDSRPVFAIDTPPPTVSGNLHLGHVYSYSQAEFMARFKRMRGYNVYYPMGYDDNGLATERLVEKRRKIRAQKVGREAFIQACLELSRQIEEDYETIWKRLGMSIDWRYTYSTVADWSRRTSQQSFIELYRKGLAYRKAAPTIWNPAMQTAIAQAELDDLERETRFVTISFRLEDGAVLPIATTRPELLPACVAVFAHPADARFAGLMGQSATTPLFNKAVPILADKKADPKKGTGAVMCCTFGDTTDIDWQREHNLPIIGVIERNGRLNQLAGAYAGLKVAQAREQIIADLQAVGLLTGEQPVTQTVRVHERDGTPVEYIKSQQWFIKLLDSKAEFLEAGRAIRWVPEQMRERYESWVEGLAWDWAISRQRYFGVPFPVWYCADCGQTIIADESQLPVDPLETQPLHPCPVCGGAEFTPERDVMDTWATSSSSPQIAGRRLQDPALYNKVFPMALRPQAHEIIRTWAFYTIVKSLYQFGRVPWETVAISGHGLTPSGEKASKSKSNAQTAPLPMMERYSADAVRLWAAGSGFGRDAWISEAQISIGQKFITKLWNVFRFSITFLQNYQPPTEAPAALTPTDKWLLAKLQRAINRATANFEAYNFTKAKSEAEDFFWNILADNYLEMAKHRLYESDNAAQRDAARYALHHALLNTIKLFAPFAPHITEEIYQLHFTQFEGAVSIHRAAWPAGNSAWENEDFEAFGGVLVAVAGEVRRYKSAHQLSLGAEFAQLYLLTDNEATKDYLQQSREDIQGVTRAKEVLLLEQAPNGTLTQVTEHVSVGIVD